MELALVGCFALLAGAIGLYAISLPQGGHVWWLLAVAIVVLVVGSRLLGDSLIGTILLDLAEFAAVALVWSQRTPEAASAARMYLCSIVPAVACTMIALVLIQAGGTRPGPTIATIIVWLVIVGFALKLGLMPFYFWLPAVAAAAAPMTAALIISIVDIATFAELTTLRQVAPWMFGDHAPAWMLIALLSMFGGALLALAQTELRRMLAFSTIADLGLLLVGLIVGGPLGISGAWFGALSHAVSKVILFGAVGLAEARIGQRVTLDTRGLAVRMPVTGAAFIVAALSFIGVPPGFGFVGYWRIYIVATQFGGLPLIAALLAVAATDLLRYARAIHRTWLGSAQVPFRGNPAYLAPGVLTVLATLTVLLGCYPSVLTAAAASELLAMAH
jgi:multicomponent Na+:H+ antiporter subunit D